MIFWSDKVHMNWLAAGYCSMTLFHRVAIQNHIQLLRDGNNVMFFEQCRVAEGFDFKIVALIPKKPGSSDPKI